MDSSTPFDRKAVRANRARIASKFSHHDFLVKEATSIIVRRIDEVKKSFPRILDLGCHTGELTEKLILKNPEQEIILADVSFEMAQIAKKRGLTSITTEEELLPFKANSFDAIISCLSLHWVNDLPGTLVQIRKILRPGGLFLASFFGGETLNELRLAFDKAEKTLNLDSSPHIAPFIDVRDAGNLLNRAQFTNPVADIDTFTVSYESLFQLMSELRGMGESNACRNRNQNFTRRELFLSTAENYQLIKENNINRLPATFQIVTVIGWSPKNEQ